MSEDALKSSPKDTQIRLTHIGDDDVEPSLLELLSLNFVKKNLVLPLKKSDGVLKVAMADHRGLFAVEEIGRITGTDVEPVLADKEAMLGAINRLYDRLSGSASEVIDDISEEGLESLTTEWEEPKDLIDLTDEAPIIRLLNSLLFQAVKDRASDIHIEPYEREVEVRFRIDGVLYHVLTPPKVLQEALVSRVKIMSGLDIAEKRLPQDGKIRLLVAGKDIYVRVSIIPTTFGERIVLRLLDRKAGIIALESLGLSPVQTRNFVTLLNRSSGILLVTGPTGAGKSTTLYSALSKINANNRNIITIEDPVEYQIKGLGQMHVNPKIGLTFATGLRSILRQDPDVIMIGEIRDRETAEIAIQASLTGHLVLSTLHTTDTATAITRLIDMGIEPYLVASSVGAIIAQKLVRVLCNDCKVEYVPTPDELKLYRRMKPPEKLWGAGGCVKCFHTGYHGRTSLFEFMLAGPDTHTLVVECHDAKEIKKEFISKGMITLFEDGLKKAAAGVTSLNEVVRVTRDRGV